MFVDGIAMSHGVPVTYGCSGGEGWISVSPARLPPQRVLCRACFPPCPSLFQLHPPQAEADCFVIALAVEPGIERLLRMGNQQCNPINSTFKYKCSRLFIVTSLLFLLYLDVNCPKTLVNKIINNLFLLCLKINKCCLLLFILTACSFYPEPCATRIVLLIDLMCMSVVETHHHICKYIICHQ